jgi:hypothetical protein
MHTVAFVLLFTLGTFKSGQTCTPNGVPFDSESTLGGVGFDTKVEVAAAVIV